MHIGNPVTWVFNRARLTGALGSSAVEEYFPARRRRAPEIKHIGLGELRTALRRGWDDFAAARTDLIMLWLIYPAMAACFVATDHYGWLIPLLFPVAAGFALVGPVFAVGFYEMSRRRELTGEIGWRDSFGVLNSPEIGGIAALGAALIGIFALWIAVAAGLYQGFLGPSPPAGWGAFLTQVFTNAAGWEMAAAGIAIGALFAALVLVLASISFPLLLDRPASLKTAITASALAAWRNKAALAGWGAIVAFGLLLGTLPLFAGLIVVLPVLGHSTWHLYRAMVD